MRKRLFEIIESPREGDRVSRAYDVFMVLTILISLVPLCTRSEAPWTDAVDVVTAVIFILDYVFRWVTADFRDRERGAAAFVRYPFGVMALIDLIAIVPSFGVLDQGLKLLKIFRMFRTLRTFKAIKAFKALKMLRYSRAVSRIVRVLKAQKEALIAVCALSIGYILIAAIVIFNVEPETFDSFFDAVYWACVSLTTVGYGDIYPVSAAGRIVTMFSAIVGVAVVALPSGILTAGYLEALRNEKEEEPLTEEEEKEH